MSTAAWIALMGILSTFALNVGGYLVAWGTLRATVNALAERVKALEVELAALTDLKLKVERIDTRQDVLIEQLRDLNAHVRWIRAPASPLADRD